MQQFEPGDTITLTITGKVVDPRWRGTPEAAEVKVTRPDVMHYIRGVNSHSIFIDLALDPGVKIDIDVTPKYKNGVHIDLASGDYWMRTPDGWLRMFIHGRAPQNVDLKAPVNPQRLMEAREK